MSTYATTARRMGAALALALALAACEPAQPQFGQCEPGVGDLSQAGTLVPNC